MERGVVKTVVIDRGFGFIRRPGVRDLFFHIKDLDPSLHFDETLVERDVEFEIVESDKGPRAANVRPETSQESIPDLAPRTQLQ